MFLSWNEPSGQRPIGVGDRQVQGQECYIPYRGTSLRGQTFWRSGFSSSCFAIIRLPKVSPITTDPIRAGQGKHTNDSDIERSQLQVGRNERPPRVGVNLITVLAQVGPVQLLFL
jgi:hypothetical protein